MNLVLAHLLGAECIGRTVKVIREGRDLLQVRELGVLGKVANAHVLEHPLAQWCHGKTPG